MPIYEYTCNACNRLSSIFVRRVASAADPKCQHCGSADLRRAVSRIAVHKTEQQILEEYGPTWRWPGQLQGPAPDRPLGGAALRADGHGAAQRGAHDD